MTDTLSSATNSAVVALIRHGDYHQRKGAPSAFQPFSLTPKGTEQAHQCVELIRNFCLQSGRNIHPQIHTSVLLRAWQTAKILANGLLPAQALLVETPLLGERCVGSLANLTAAEIEAVIKQDPRYPTQPKGWKSDSYYQLPYPGAESLMQAGSRVADYLNQLVSDSSDNANTVHIVVGHGAAFRHAAHLLGTLEFNQIAMFSMYHATPVFLRRDADLDWHHHSGEWKRRQSNIRFTD